MWSGPEIIRSRRIAVRRSCDTKGCIAIVRSVAHKLHPIGIGKTSISISGPCLIKTIRGRNPDRPIKTCETESPCLMLPMQLSVTFQEILIPLLVNPAVIEGGQSVRKKAEQSSAGGHSKISCAEAVGAPIVSITDTNPADSRCPRRILDTPRPIAGH